MRGNRFCCPNAQNVDRRRTLAYDRFEEGQLEDARTIKADMGLQDVEFVTTAVMESQK